MPVVSNTSPLLNLAIIDSLFLLPQQFGQVLIPQAVLTELKVDQDLPGSSALYQAIDQGWLIPKSVSNPALVRILQQQLHWGEAEAIALAVEVSAERILVISHSNKGGLMRKPPETQNYPGKSTGGEHPEEAMSSKRWSTAFLP